MIHELQYIREVSQSPRPLLVQVQQYCTVSVIAPGTGCITPRVLRQYLVSCTSTYTKHNDTSHTPSHLVLCTPTGAVSYKRTRSYRCELGYSCLRTSFAISFLWSSVQHEAAMVWSYCLGWYSTSTHPVHPKPRMIRRFTPIPASYQQPLHL